MDSGLYAAYAGLLTRTQALDIAANNLANAGTNGFRAGAQSFRSVLAEANNTPPSQVGGAVNAFGVLGGNALKQTSGAIAPTGNPLDVALQGTGFFAVQTTHGTRYTRDGAFRLADSGQLQTASGDAVLDTQGQSIVLPDGTVRISEDGTISVATAQGSGVVAKLGVLDLGKAGVSTAEGASLYQASDAAAVVPGTATVRQGALESSNEDAVTGTMQLMSLQRQTEMMQRALTVFHNDFDKTAAEELPRV